jgi:hypothetical protein
MALYVFYFINEIEERCKLYGKLTVEKELLERSIET